MFRLFEKVIEFFHLEKEPPEVQMVNIDPEEIKEWEKSILATPDKQIYYEFDRVEDAVNYLKILPEKLNDYFFHENDPLNKQKKLAFVLLQLTQVMSCLTAEKAYVFKFLPDQFPFFLAQYKTEVFTKLCEAAVIKMQEYYNATMKRTAMNSYHLHPEVLCMFTLFLQHKSCPLLTSDAKFFNNFDLQQKVFAAVMSCREVKEIIENEFLGMQNRKRYSS